MKFSGEKTKTENGAEEEAFQDALKSSEGVERRKPLSIEDDECYNTDSSRDEAFAGNYSRPQFGSNVIEYCRTLMFERKQLMLRSLLLQKKLRDWQTKGGDISLEANSVLNSLEETLAKLLYQKNLLTFEEILNQSTSEKGKIDLKSKELFQRWTESLNTAANEEDSLIRAEEMYGNQIIKYSSGKVLLEKDLTLLVNRHKEVIANSAMAVLKYIRVRDLLLKKEAALKSFQDFGKSLSLIQYELLNLEKSHLQNKIEERSAVLDHLNGNIEAVIVKFALIKGKISGCEVMMEQNLQLLAESNYLLHLSQDKRAMLRKQNVELRGKIEILLHEAGILEKHSLLRDFDNTSLQTDCLKHEVNYLQNKLKKLLFKKDKMLKTQESKYIPSSTLNYSFSQNNDTSVEIHLSKQHQKQVDGIKICKGRPSIEKVGKNYI